MKDIKLMKVLRGVPFCGVLMATAACVEPPGALQAESLGSADLAVTGYSAGQYTLSVVVTSGDPAPGGGTLLASFYPSDINEPGDVVFTTFLPNGEMGSFRTNDGTLETLARTGGNGPGGVQFGPVFGFASGSLNNGGDAAFVFSLDGPFTLPAGSRFGVFRSDEDGTQSAVVLPDVTLAPDGSPFRGAFLRTSLDNHSTLAFSGLIDTSDGIHVPGQPHQNLGYGVFVANPANDIESIVSPGDPAPGGGTFDFAQNPTINAHGDVAFGAHVAGEECLELGTTQAQRIFCAESVYLYEKGHGKKGGEIRSIAHQGDPAPGGGTYRFAFGPVLDDKGNIVFSADLTPPPGSFATVGVFLHRKGQTVPVARPGDAMPGGGNIVSTSRYVTGYDMNNAGEVVFFATLDTDEAGHGYNDTGIYIWKKGQVRLVLRTGMTIDDLGTVDRVANGGGANGLAINDSGQVVVPVGLTNGQNSIVIATPTCD